MSEQSPAPEAFLEDGTLTASAWARALREGVPLGQRCGACDHVTAAPKAACVRCGGRGLTVEALPTAGEVYAETTIAVPPKGFDGPYRVGLVALGGARVLGRLPDGAEVGDDVSLPGVVEDGDRVAPRFG